MVFIIALIVACCGMLPLLVARQFGKAVLAFIISALVSGLYAYIAIPALNGPLYSSIGILGFIAAACGVIFVVIIENDASDTDIARTFKFTGVPTALLGIIVLGYTLGGCHCVRADDYQKLLGPVEERSWSDDLQPADTTHINSVPAELALYLADKQLGSMGNSIGSQYELRSDQLTIQVINGQLWYVAPLDYRGVSVWVNAGHTPGYVMVSAEDPHRDPIVKSDEKYVYMPSAYLGDNLKRHLWHHGYAEYDLTDETFEVDEDGKGWWVVTLTKPTISYWGDMTQGVVIVNPTDGTHIFYAKSNVPHWVDRVMPHELTQDYIQYHGKYIHGWVNSWWNEKGTTTTDSLIMMYGNDGEPYWVADITSTNSGDTGLLGLMYVNARTGAAHYYRVNRGGTYETLVHAANTQVEFKKWHAANPVIYNLYGELVAITPILGSNNAFQGIGIVDLKDGNVTWAETQQEALRIFKTKVGQGTRSDSINAAGKTTVLNGVVERFAFDIRSGNTAYFITIRGQKHIFTGDSSLSPRLPLVHVGDNIKVSFIDGTDDLIPLTAFEMDQAGEPASQIDEQKKSTANDTKK